jgi:DNA primase catalytic subunit
MDATVGNAGKDAYTNQALWGVIQRELTLGLLYPKIDSHVSAQVNHLLKCPFNVHHETGLVSLPLLDVRNFKIDQTPNVIDVLANPQLLDPYLKAFDIFCSRLIQKRD